MIRCDLFGTAPCSHPDFLFSATISTLWGKFLPISVAVARKETPSKEYKFPSNSNPQANTGNLKNLLNETLKTTIKNMAWNFYGSLKTL